MAFALPVEWIDCCRLPAAKTRMAELGSRGKPRKQSGPVRHNYISLESNEALPAHRQHRVPEHRSLAQRTAHGVIRRHQPSINIITKHGKHRWQRRYLASPVWRRIGQSNHQQSKTITMQQYPTVATQSFQCTNRQTNLLHENEAASTIARATQLGPIASLYVRSTRRNDAGTSVVSCETGRR